MTTFTNTLTLINTIRTTSCHNSPIETIAYFKHIMDEKTFLAFEKSAKEELTMQIVERFWSFVNDFKRIPMIEEYIYSKAFACCPFYDHDTCYDEFFATILHDAVGYLGYYLTDEEFEDFHGWYDEHYCHEGYLSAIEMMLKNEPIHSNLSTLNEYCEKYGVDINIFYPKYEVVEEIDMSEERDDFDENTRVYSIIKTSVLDDMGVTVVRTTDTTGLGFMEYGFERDECERIAKLDCNDTYNSWDYTGSIIVVRMN